MVVASVNRANQEFKSAVSASEFNIVFYTRIYNYLVLFGFSVFRYKYVNTGSEVRISIF